MTTNTRGLHGVWLSEPSASTVEVAALAGYDTVVLDVEHGSFDLAALNWLLPFIRAKGMEVIVKVLGPQREAIQQALDLGANAVAIPHVESVEHAELVCGFAKFPPLGDRSFAGGRVSNYRGFDDAWVVEQDAQTRCYPMIEDASAFADIEQILALDVVDGIFIGPSDLSLRRDRGAYTVAEGDVTDIAHLADAANAAGKPWILPAWSPAEQKLAVDKNAHLIIATMQYGALLSGLSGASAALHKIQAAAGE
ncbi:HpcH/HpaI aldolase/citrate lyase family protein [Nesterenkonia halotolerans]|uniref:HpcH/HpaI aldolase family protein n=1 Tax=Nesterenkonia halotolerans TaxID=225325 RepID=UPI003EE6E6E0